MSGPPESLRDKLMRLLLEQGAALPTSSTRRFGRTALTALKAGRFIRKQRRRGQSDEEAPVDVEALVGILTSIGSLKGIAMKMGQIMSYIDVALPEELRTALSVLQTHAQPMDFRRVQEIISGELPARAGDLLATMEPKPLAAASIGQVHRARLPDGTAVAVKVQYPGIAAAIRSDFRPAALGTKLAGLMFPAGKIEGFVEEARERFLEECDYLHEAAVQTRFAGLFRDHPRLVVPAVHRAYCSRSVLTTAFVAGLGFEETLARGLAQEDRDRFGRDLFAFYIGTLFRHGLYNCDPHPGNYLFLPDSRLAMLDYGCAREFAPAFVATLAALTRAVHADDRDALMAAFTALGMARPGRRFDFDTARAVVRSFYGPMSQNRVCRIELGEALQTREIYRAKMRLLRLSLPREFLFLFRIRFGLLSVLARLGAQANWYALEREFLDAVPA